MPIYIGLTLAEFQVPTKPFYHSSPSTGQGEKNAVKGLWIKIRTNRLFRVTGKTDLTQGN